MYIYINLYKTPLVRINSSLRGRDMRIIIFRTKNEKNQHKQTAIQQRTKLCTSKGWVNLCQHVKHTSLERSCTHQFFSNGMQAQSNAHVYSQFLLKLTAHRVHAWMQVYAQHLKHDPYKSYKFSPSSKTNTSMVYFCFV